MKKNIVGSIGFCIIIILIFGTIPFKVRQIEVCSKGTKINAVITKLPTYGRNHSFDVKFQYINSVFYNSHSKSFCQKHKIGDSIVFLNYSKYPDIFIIPGNPMEYFIEIIIAFIFSSFGLLLIIKRKEFAEKF